ncbi:MAG: hypothetical protein ACOYXC_18955 [Candidatus Rifleibacteriota bacterium]
MKDRSAISMVELLVAIAVLSFALGPLVVLLSSSNQMSNQSMYEELSVHHCRVLTDQFLRFTPKISRIVENARKITGNTKLNLGDLLNDKGFNNELSDPNRQRDFIPFQYLGKETSFRMFVPRMNDVFIRRFVEAELLDSSSNKHLKDANFWKIKVTVAWKASENEQEKDTCMAVIIGEDL